MTSPTPVAGRDARSSRIRDPLPWGRLAALFAASALLAPFVWSGVSARLAPPVAAPAHPLVALPPGGIPSIAVRGDGVAGVFDRAGTGWTFAPEGGAARSVDPDVPEGFLRTITGLTRLTQFVDPAVAAFGLAAPRGSFALGGSSGVRVDIGDRNPTLTAVYVRLGDSPEVVLVGSVLLWEWDKLLAEARRSDAPAGEQGGSR